MNLELSDEQELMVQTFRSFFRREVPLSLVRAAATSGSVDRGLWERFIAMGGHTVALPVKLGGGGGSLVDAALVGFEAGRVLAPIPYADTAAALRAAARGRPDPLGWAGDGPWAVTTEGTVTDGPRGLTGTVRWLAAGSAARFVLLFLRDGSAAVLPVDPDGSVTPLSNLAGLPCATVDFVDTTALARWSVEPHEADETLAELRLLYAALLVGCGRTALDLAVGHVRERRQFGHPIGSFQTIQHRLADCVIALDAAELLVLRAAAYEGEVSELVGRAAMASLQAGEAAEQTATEALQFFGGYGYTLEYDIQLFLRYAKSLAVIVRDQERILDEVPLRPADLLDAAESDSDRQRSRRLHQAGGVEFRRGDEEASFAEDVRRFLAVHLTEEVRARVGETGTGYDPGFHRAMAQRGWICASLPTDAGGGGLDPARTAVLWEMMYYADAPVEAQQLSEIVASIVAQVGTHDQRGEILAPIVRGDLLCALGYTEPDAGSDLAAVASRAERVDGGYLINGTKMFTTMAHVADYVLLLVRTDPDAPKHRGLSLFLVPLRDEGVEIQPIHTLGGERTNTTFYRDVFVPEGMRVGPENAGWSVLNMGLAVERAAVGGFVGRAWRVYDDVISALQGEQNGRLSPALQRHMAEQRTRIEAASVLCDRVYCHLASGRAPDVEAAMAKIAATDTFKGLARRALDLAGPVGLLSRPLGDPSLTGRLEHAFRHAQISTIYAGANEVLRNLVANRGLALPRS
ncbi:MAG: acyl-CoA dehydrogenase [Actinomycetota bacterium]